ncbi:MAG: hypothetical protein Q9201_005003, partial [Fulgogasparrea decipioides]
IWGTDNVPDTYLPMRGKSASLLDRNGGGPAADAEKRRGSGLGSVRYPDEGGYADRDPDRDNNDDDDGPVKTPSNPVHHANDVAPAVPETSHPPDANTVSASDGK